MKLHPIRYLILLMIVTAVPCDSDSPAKIETTKLTAFVGTCVEIRCKVVRKLPEEDALWFWMKYREYDSRIKDYSHKIVYSNKPTERPISPLFEGRVNYTGSTSLAYTASRNAKKPSCSVSICYLTVQDSGSYFSDTLLRIGTMNENPCAITFNKPAAVKEGQTINLTCSTPTSCSLYLEIQSVPSSHLKTHQTRYSYTATASFTASWRITAEIKPRNTDIETDTQTREVAVGGSVTFKCKTDANPLPLEYYWYRDRSSFQTTDTNSLELKSVQRTDKACYKCKAQNKLGSGDYSSDLCLEVLVPPTSLTLSMDTEVTEGQRVSITCRVDSSPVSTLTLSRTLQGSKVELLKNTDQNSLSYSVTVSSEHSGEYTCSAHNRVGSDSTKRSLQVKYAPQNVRVQADPGLTVKENTTVTLNCSAQSHPPLSSVTWSRGPTGQELSVHTGHTFSVRSVSVSDSGLYTCTAHNQVGNTTSATAHLIVNFGPKQTVVLRAEEEQGPDGSRSVTLSCSSHSVPPVRSYTWYRRTEDRELKVSENINYTVLSTQPGVYYCTAKNEISERTSEPVSLFQGSYVKFIFLALVPLLVILCAFLLHRYKTKSSVEEERANKSCWRSCSRPVGRWHSSRSNTQDVHAQNPARPQQSADMINGTSNADILYSTVDHCKNKQGRPAASRDQNTQADSLFYASLHFDKTKPTVSPEEEEEVIYSNVTQNEEEGDVYENITKVQEATWSGPSDCCEDEVEVNYSSVNFRSRARHREQTRVTAEEEDYSELHL
ncbi:hypothetical protein WMY93_026618 [Mugilogobius chulae]|uniref:B-cell receptor CD22 n=1 Tax=Mugilogobius chulae TaxID=88201 RepID=A0AAW0MXW9_9GOBI